MKHTCGDLAPQNTNMNCFNAKIQVVFALVCKSIYQHSNTESAPCLLPASAWLCFFALPFVPRQVAPLTCTAGEVCSEKMAKGLCFHEGNTLGEAPRGAAHRRAGNSGSIRGAGAGVRDFGELLPFLPHSSEMYECKELISVEINISKKKSTPW